MPEAADTFSGKLSLRSNFAIHHLRAAIEAGQSAHEVEQANDVTDFGPWFSDMMMHVPVAVIMSATALEGNCREIIQDRIDKLSPVQPAPGALKGFKALKGDGSGVMERYSKLSQLFGKPPATWSSAWLNAALLFKFRNCFIHFEPTWDYETNGKTTKLATELKAQVQISPAYKGDMFPYPFMTYDCAKWAIKSAREFSAEFCALIGVEDRFASVSALP